MSSQINNTDSKEGSDQKKKGSFRDKIMNEIIKKNLYIYLYKTMRKKELKENEQKQELEREKKEWNQKKEEQKQELNQQKHFIDSQLKILDKQLEIIEK